MHRSRIAIRADCPITESKERLMGIFSKDDPKPKPDFSNVQLRQFLYRTRETRAAPDFREGRGDHLYRRQGRQFVEDRKAPIWRCEEVAP